MAAVKCEACIAPGRARIGGADRETAVCERYVSPDDTAIRHEFNLAHVAWEFPSSFNVAPTQSVPVVRAADGAREGLSMRWGLIPAFAHGEPPKYPTINARIETVETAASYQGAWKRGRRCLQVARGFYEWHLDDRGREVPYYMHLKDQDIFAFAGLWDRSSTADGTAVESCAHITMPANALMHRIHNSGGNPFRMPAILRKQDHDAWLNGTPDQARAVLAQYDAGLMLAYEVTTAVNSPKYNAPTNIEPLKPFAPWKP